MPSSHRRWASSESFGSMASYTAMARSIVAAPSVAALSPGGLTAPESHTWCSNRAGRSSRSRQWLNRSAAQRTTRGMSGGIRLSTADRAVQVPESMAGHVDGQPAAVVHRPIAPPSSACPERLPGPEGPHGHSGRAASIAQRRAGEQATPVPRRGRAGRAASPHHAGAAGNRECRPPPCPSPGPRPPRPPATEPRPRPGWASGPHPGARHPRTRSARARDCPRRPGGWRRAAGVPGSGTPGPRTDATRVR